MNLKILFGLLIYYTVISVFFLAGGSQYTDAGFNETASDQFNLTLNEGELDEGGFFGTGVSFGRYLGFVTVGVGLPSDTPAWFSLILVAWQSLMTVFVIGFIISSIWDG